MEQADTSLKAVISHKPNFFKETYILLEEYNINGDLLSYSFVNAMIYCFNFYLLTKVKKYVGLSATIYFDLLFNLLKLL